MSWADVLARVSTRGGTGASVFWAAAAAPFASASAGAGLASEAAPFAAARGSMCSCLSTAGDSLATCRVSEEKLGLGLLMIVVAAVLVVLPLKKGWAKNSSKEMRSTGLRRKSWWISCWQAGDNEDARASGILGSLRSMFCKSCRWLAPLKGGLPISSS